MKLKITLAALGVLLCVFLASAAYADELAQGKTMIASGDFQGAAVFFNQYASSHQNDAKKAPEALALCGRLLDALSDSLTGAAEKSCYWSKGGGGSPDCMQRFASQYNARFGEGAFRYEHAVTFIVYTGSHYRKIMESFPNSDFAAEADFYLTLHGLIGHPDVVLPKIKAFLSRHPKGEWNRRGLLLWARVNEDVWYVHRKWSWVLFNYQVSPEDLIIKAEPYRQEALRTYEKLMKEKGTPEALVAEREHATLKANQEDPTVYSIVNDSNPGSLKNWGVDAPVVPAEPYKNATPGKQPAGAKSVSGGQAAQPVMNTPTTVIPATSSPTEKQEGTKQPQRWE